MWRTAAEMWWCAARGQCPPIDERWLSSAVQLHVSPLVPLPLIAVNARRVAICSDAVYAVP